MSLRGQYLRVVGLIVLALTLVAVLQQFLDSYLAGDSLKAVRLTETTQGTEQLPQSWQVERGTIETRVFSFDVYIDTTPDAQLAIYFPAFEQRLKVEINQHPLVASELTNSWFGPLTLATAFIELPAGVLRQGHNEVEVSVEAGPLVSATLSPFLIGETDALRSVANLRKFVGVDLAEMLLGIHFLMIFMCLIALWEHPQESGFKWLMISLIPSTLFSFGIMSDYIPSFYLLTPTLFISSVVTSAALYGFSFAVEGKSPPRWLIPGVCLYLVVLIPTALLFPSALRALVFLLVIPLFILFLFAGLWRFIGLVVRYQGVGYFWICIGIALVLFSTLRDWSMRAGLINDGVFLWTSPVRTLLLVGVCTFLLSRMGSRTEALRISNDEITQRLQERETELDDLYRRRQLSKQREAVAEERARILKELHDGVAGQLVVISTLASKREPDADAIRVTAKNALTDLRSVVTTLAIKETDLLQILGIFREKYLSQLDSLGVSVHWNLLHAPDVYGFNSQDALNLTRILQEALNNAVKHSDLESISVSAEELELNPGNLAVKLTFESHGVGGFEPVNLGQGLNNIAQRADQLGASVDFVPLVGGLSLEVFFRVERRESDNRLWLDRAGNEFDMTSS